jgi:hypothetical protein
MFGLNEKNAVARATLKADGRDDSSTISVWEYKVKQLRGVFGGTCQYKNIDDYITENERPAIEAKRKRDDIECNERFAATKKHSDVDASLHFNYNE